MEEKQNDRAGEQGLALETKLEALLFWKGEPMTVKKIGEELKVPKNALEEAVIALEKSLSHRGLRIVRNGDEIEMRTAPEASDLIERLTKEELYRDLGKAGLETLSIILYKGPLKRSDIDYIRGVNSSFIIRNLLIRGLIERVGEKESVGRGYTYKTTIALLSHLGLAKIEELPEYSAVRAEIESFERQEQEAEREEKEDKS